MEGWEKAAVLVNGMVGLAAAATAWAAFRSAKAAEKAASGNTQALRVAQDSADAARDAADSFGEAVEEFRAQVEVGEKRAAIDSERLEHEKELVEPALDIELHGLEGTGQHLRCKVSITNVGNRQVIVMGITFEVEDGQSVTAKFTKGFNVPVNHRKEATIGSNEQPGFRASLRGRKPTGKAWVLIGSSGRRFPFQFEDKFRNHLLSSLSKH